MKAFTIRLRQYYYLTKPGIVQGNLIAAGAGFLLAADGLIDLWLLVATLTGIALIIASGCVINNYIDRDIDKHMARTRKRALATGSLSNRNALIYGGCLGVIGFATLAIWTNWLVVLIGIIGLFDYVVLYGWSKRKSVHGTLVGSVSGSMPPLAGYVAVTGNIDIAAVALFLMMTFWQMAHFYAIALRRLDDYRAAGIPVLPAVKGIALTKRHTLIYVSLFSLASMLLYLEDYTGKTYLIVMCVLGLAWLGKGLRGLHDDDKTWAKEMFNFSLVVLLVFNTVIALNWLLP